MKNIIHLNDVPLMKNILGFALIFFGLLIFLSENIVFGLIFIVIGMGISTKEGIEINLENKSYRELKSLFGFKMGKWKSCPDFEYVSVFKTNQGATIRVITAETTLTKEVILVNLFYSTNKFLTIYKSSLKEDAFKIAKEFSNVFQIDILDATEKERKWIT